MRDFFHGWRRKVGCLALVMACVVFGLWMRSRVVIDFCEITVGDREHCFGSYHGYLSWRTWDASYGQGSLWQSLPAQDHAAATFLNLESEAVKPSNSRQWIVPHIWAVAALTLLAALLIVWRPRKSRSRRIDASNLQGQRPGPFASQGPSALEQAPIK